MIQRAKCGNVGNVENYVCDLGGNIMLKINPILILALIQRAMHRIKNLLMLFLELNITSLYLLCQRCATKIDCASGSWFAVPPYFVCVYQRMVNDLMTGTTPGAGGSVSDYGWFNTKVYQQYLTDNHQI